MNWMGDNVSAWEHLRLTIPMIANLGLSGLGMTLVAPGRSEIARRQRAIDEAHSGYDLTRSLMRAPDRPRTA